MNPLTSNGITVTSFSSIDCLAYTSVYHPRHLQERDRLLNMEKGCLLESEKAVKRKGHRNLMPWITAGNVQLPSEMQFPKSSTKHAMHVWLFFSVCSLLNHKNRDIGN